MKAMDLQPAIDLLDQHCAERVYQYRIPEATPCLTGDHGDYEEICQSQSSRGLEYYRKEQLAKDLFFWVVLDPLSSHGALVLHLMDMLLRLLSA